MHMPEPSSPETLGLIGAGLLGTALAERLLASGFSLLVWDREEMRRTVLAELGAARAGEAKAIGGRCTHIILSLPDSNIVAAVLAEMRGSLRAGSVVIDTSTGDPAQSKQFAEMLAKQDVAYLDATISGSSEQLRRGEALTMVGGAVEAFRRCTGVWASWGGRTLHVGESGDGARLKLVTNLVLGLNRAALAEGLALADAMGLDPTMALKVLRSGAAYSRIMDSKGEKMITGNFTPQARLSQHLKDVRLILQSAAQNGITLPLSETHRQLLERAETEGMGALDNSAIIEVLRKSKA
jgi:3-hydroxyisobutyrate dehydrogenase-like beta-hydroxyacid dehydrogenase